MDRIPHQVYGRMRMCRAMVNDHFTPAYLAAMASAVTAFEAGYPAERLKFDGDSASGEGAEAATPCGAGTVNGGEASEALERSIGTAQPSAEHADSGIAFADQGSNGHAKTA